MANNTPSYASSALPKISLESDSSELYADTAEEAARCCRSKVQQAGAAAPLL